MWHSGGAAKAQHRRGSAAIAAVAIIVIVGFLGAALISSLQLTNASTVNHVLGVQAYYTADAGVEWACKQDSATPAPITFADGTFEATADGSDWVSVGEVGEAKCTLRCDPAPVQGPISNGLDVVLGSREEHWSKTPFQVMNNTTGDITFNKMKVDWDSPTAYFQKIQIKVINGTDYKEVWKYEDDPEGRWTNGDTRQFNQVASVTIPAHYTAAIKMEGYRAGGDGTGSVDMNSTTLIVTLYNNDTLVHQLTVDTAPQP